VSRTLGDFILHERFKAFCAQDPDPASAAFSAVVYRPYASLNFVDSWRWVSVKKIAERMNAYTLKHGLK